MAIKLETSTLNEPSDYICKSDPAVNSDGEDFDEVWQRHRDHGEPLPMRDGQEPTVFQLAPLSGSRVKTKLADIQSREGHIAGAVLACALSLKGVRNLQDADGKPLKLRHVREDGFDVVDPEQLNLLPFAILIELGSAALESMNPS